MINKLINIALCVAIVSSTIGEAKANTNTNWTKSTHALNKSIIDLWIDGTLSAFIINKCKATAVDPRKCVRTSIAIYWNESWYGKYCKNNSCWGVLSKSYRSQIQAADDWIDRYNKYWYKHNGGFFFYWDWGKNAPSNYCTSEVSSGSKISCPFGNKAFNYIYSKI